ncbi:MAG: hypothetical protein ACOYL3_15290 [Desulfuromonadaceae bacterium]
MNIRTILLAGTVALSLSACGDGGGTSTDVLAPGTYKLTFSAISTARLPAAISGVDVAVKFPVGLSVSTISGGTGQIVSASITPGSAIQTTSLVYGNYSASTRTAYLSMATTQVSYRSGQFMNLLFTVASGTSVTKNDIFLLNATYPKYKVVGFDEVTHSTVTMSGTVKTMLGVER